MIPGDHRVLPAKPQTTDKLVLSFTVPTANFAKDGFTWPTAGVPLKFRGMFVSRDSKSL